MLTPNFNFFCKSANLCYNYLVNFNKGIGTVSYTHLPRSVKFLCIIAAPEGLEALKKAHPDVDIFGAGMDDHLNENGYIVPGLGDAGDRIFGTK